MAPYLPIYLSYIVLSYYYVIIYITLKLLHAKLSIIYNHGIVIINFCHDYNNILLL